MPTTSGNGVERDREWQIWYNNSVNGNIDVLTHVYMYRQVQFNTMFCL